MQGKCGWARGVALPPAVRSWPSAALPCSSDISWDAHADPRTAVRAPGLAPRGSPAPLAPPTPRPPAAPCAPGRLSAYPAAPCRSHLNSAHGRPAARPGGPGPRGLLWGRRQRVLHPLELARARVAAAEPRRRRLLRAHSPGSRDAAGAAKARRRLGRGRAPHWSETRVTRRAPPTAPPTARGHRDSEPRPRPRPLLAHTLCSELAAVEVSTP